MDQERIIKINIEEEMKSSYIDYAMSVIIGRAIPDIRDGLKPVHRRILYTMKELGIVAGRPYKKCARIVGDTMGKYHPHGDGAIYDSLVKMAQDFSTRYPLIDGQGNFGSIDGDPAAAYRYTEARTEKITTELYADLEKNTVNFRPNFDNSESEPEVFPTKYPNLLANGSTGIAVGMATEIPPHNLCELTDGCIATLDNPSISTVELMQHIKGPDFPTAGVIVGKSGIFKAFDTGRGKITIRGVVKREKIKQREALIITEIPYQLNKASFIEKMVDLVKAGTLTQIADIRDESNRKGMRIVIECKRDANIDILENKIYQLTPLQKSYGIIMLALVKNRPAVLPLRSILNYFIDHRKEVIRRRTQFDLDKAERRAHILEGLLKALDSIDEVIKTIRASKTTDEALGRLMINFDFSERQAKAILEMRLQRLTGLERDKLEAEFAELQKSIAYFKAILSDQQMVIEIIKEELTEIKNKYGNPRKTEIIDSTDSLDITMEDLIENKEMVITITKSGYIKRTDMDQYRAQNRGGKGSKGATCKENDLLENVLAVKNHNTLMFFTNMGKVFTLKAYQIEETQRATRGKHMVNYIELTEGEKVTSVFSVDEFKDDMYLFMVTKNAKVKKTKLSLFQKVRKKGIIAINLLEEDSLVTARLTDGKKHILIFSKKGKAARISETEIRELGRASQGVRGLKLQKNDEVIEAVIFNEDNTSISVLTVTEKGFAKRTPVDEYTCIHRGGSGVISHRLTPSTGEIVGANIVEDDNEILLLTRNGKIIRVRAKAFSVYSRATKGMKALTVDGDDIVTSIAKIVLSEEEKEAEATEES